MIGGFGRAAPHGHVGISILLTSVLLVGGTFAIAPGTAPSPSSGRGAIALPAVNDPVGNFSSAVNRLVDLLAIAGGGILALVWARVAFSWFSNDITKKVQAKDRARDALIGSLIFTAAITGLVWGLAQWVITGV